MRKLAFFVFLSLISLSALAHEKHQHSKSVSKEDKAKDNALILSQINDGYLKKVKLIFEKKCFDCHSSQTRYPIYYKILGIKGLIDSDIQEAKKHLDMTKDFPFEGHGSPKEDLEAIGKAVNENTMPPFRYWIVNWKSRLNEDDRKIINEWIEESVKMLSNSQ